MKYTINHEFVSISSQTATHRIILMHGWGADSDDLFTFGKEMTEKINLDFEVISLRAPGYIQVVREDSGMDYTHMIGMELRWK